MRGGLRTVLLWFAMASAFAGRAVGQVHTEDEMTTSSLHKPRPAIPSAADLAKLPPDGGPDWNRLVFEKSPYLQQHAANPVDWRPWGAEAFDAARKEDKPVFLSIGYSTCHWCHVMEHESFEDDAVAKLMNDAFICVKVDREERPDIDQVYMTVTQAMTGSGGWPMTVLLTPDRKPFFAGTYFPKDSRYGRPGMIDLVPHIQGLWKTDRAKLLESADYISAELGKISRPAAGDPLTSDTLALAFEELHGRFDSTHGGFGNRPKFPVPHNFSFLLHYWKRTGDKDALAMVEKSLTKMRQGGIFDQVGYGFHRYSTDELWLVPHFEKMLYDQALLLNAYAEAYQATGDDSFKRTAGEIIEYVLRDLRSPEGGFYSAEDADSEGVEGKFYVWTMEDLVAAIGKDDAEFFAKAYSFQRDGNFYEESTGHATGENIPHLKGTPTEQLERLEAIRAKLFAIRDQRVHPFKDDKILTDWNGLMIAALAKAGMAFDEPRYTDAARKAADFALTTLRAPDGRLHKRYRQGEAGLPAHLEDYSFLAYGLEQLYEATFDEKYLKASLELMAFVRIHFHDDAGGAFFHTSDEGEALIVRAKDIYDGAIPSGNSVAATTLLRLSHITGNTEMEAQAREAFKTFSKQVAQSPSNFSQLMIALDYAESPSREIVIAGEIGDPTVQAMAREIRRRLLPNTVLIFRPEKLSDELKAIAPELEGKKAIGGKATAYVCSNFTCKAPVTTVEALLKELGP
ncbi:thioredoxin domain-containing protein [soil metagenome]